MPAQKTPTAPHVTLLDGLNVKSRADGTVHTIKSAAGAVVAEVCVGKKQTRLNFKQTPKSLPKSVELSGQSKSWPGGGIVVTAANASAVRSVLVGVVGKVAPAKAA